MTPTDRNPDINLDSESVPSGMQLIAGKMLMNIARFKKVPFGVATRAKQYDGWFRMETVGIIVRDEHADIMHAGIAEQEVKRAKRKQLA